jgi:hypothetical protein
MRQINKKSEVVKTETTVKSIKSIPFGKSRESAEMKSEGSKPVQPYFFRRRYSIDNNGGGYQGL